MTQASKSLAMKLLLAGAVGAALATSPAALAQQGAGPGSCGKGKVWNPETKKCVKKPKGSGSGSWSGVRVDLPVFPGTP
jgi:hypothetical protein